MAAFLINGSKTRGASSARAAWWAKRSSLVHLASRCSVVVSGSTFQQPTALLRYLALPQWCDERSDLREFVGNGNPLEENQS